MLGIMIVDDDDLSADFLSEHLEMLGYRTHRAASGENALALLGAGDRPDAIFISLSTNALSGFETARLVRERYRYDPTIVGLSAQEDDVDIATGIAAGIDAWLSRPINTTQLASTLERWLNEH
ncbi:MAG: response regulator [Natronospirillum sp.]